MKAKATPKNLFTIITLLLAIVGLSLLLRDLSFRRANVSAVREVPSGVFQSPQRTPTARATPSPVSSFSTATALATVAPPPGWPTGEPWPPEVTLPTPESMATSLPYPTPVFEPPSSVTPPEHLQSVWYSYWPAPDIAPQLARVYVDEQGRHWAQDAQTIDIGLRSVFSGPSLVDLHPSPDQRFLVADLAIGESLGSVLVDLQTGASRLLLPDRPDTRFLSWAPDSQRVLVQFGQLFTSDPWLVDIESHRYQPINFPRSDFGDSLLRAAAYSPDGSHLADAVVYPAVYGVRDVEMVEIGVRKAEEDERQVIAQIPGATYVVDHSLKWSPDGNRLIWIANVVADTTSSPINLVNAQTQLWMADLSTGSVKMIGGLGEAVQYSHPAVWSPEGQYVAALKVDDVRDGKEVTNNVHLFDPRSGTRQQSMGFVGQQLSHLAWSLDGQQLAAAVATGEHGEIWVTDLKGTKSHPIAGPSVIDTPFVWLP